MQMRRTTDSSWLAMTLAVGVAVLVAACGPADDGDTPGIEPGEETIEPDADDPDEPDDAASDSREVTLARADAAERLGVDEDEVELVTFETVTWPDGAIGCPEPGEMYTQALVEGYRIVLSADGTELTYHGETGQDPFLCEDPEDPAEEGS